MSKSKSDVDILAKGLDGSRRQQAEAIANFVDGRIAGLREEVNGLIDTQAKNIEIAEADGSSEAAKVVNEGTAAVVAADQAVEEAEAEPTPEKAKAAAEAVEEAAGKVEEVKSDLEQRVAEIEETLAPWRKDEKLGDRKPSRFDPLEQDLPKALSASEEAKAASAKALAQSDQALSASAEAMAGVRASRGPALWIVALVTFVVALFITGIFAGFTELTFFWDAVWLSVAVMAFVTIVTWVLDSGISKYMSRRKSKSQAKSAEDNHGLEIVREKQDASTH